MKSPSVRFSHISLRFLRPKPLSEKTLSLLLPHRSHLSKPPIKLLSFSSKPFSTTITRYPLQYDLIISRPAHQPPRPKQLARSNSPDPEPEPELGFDDWVDRKLTSPPSETESLKPVIGNNLEMDKFKRKYYNKRRRRMYGSDSEDEERRAKDDGFVELKPEVVEFRTLHKREEELYFYDAFAYPWEKEKHYKMVYQLEKKYFPDQCFDKAFLQPGESNAGSKAGKEKSGERRESGADGGDERRLVFFEEVPDERENRVEKDVKIDISEKKVEEFFKCLKKVPNKEDDMNSLEPFVSTRSNGLPPKWDGPSGTVVLVNKPKGELDISFAVL